MKKLPFNLSREDIDLLKNQVINDSVQTWKKLRWRYWKKSLNLVVCVLEFRCVCVERERERKETFKLVKNEQKDS